MPPEYAPYAGGEKNPRHLDVPQVPGNNVQQVLQKGTGGELQRVLERTRAKYLFSETEFAALYEDTESVFAPLLLCMTDAHSAKAVTELAFGQYRLYKEQQNLIDRDEAPPHRYRFGLHPIVFALNGLLSVLLARVLFLSGGTVTERTRVFKSELRNEQSVLSFVFRTVLKQAELGDLVNTGWLVLELLASVLEVSVFADNLSLGESDEYLPDDFERQTFKELQETKETSLPA